MAASRTRPLLLAAFSGLAGLGLLAGFDAIRTLSHTRSTEASLRAEFMRRGELIDRIRGARTDQLAPQIDLLRELCDTMANGSLCAMGSMTPYPVLSALDHFPEDFRGARA